MQTGRETVQSPIGDKMDKKGFDQIACDLYERNTWPYNGEWEIYEDEDGSEYAFRPFDNVSIYNPHESVVGTDDEGYNFINGLRVIPMFYERYDDGHLNHIRNVTLEKGKIVLDQDVTKML